MTNTPSRVEEIRAAEIERIAKKHFPQLQFYPELLPIVQEAFDAGRKYLLALNADLLRALEKYGRHSSVCSIHDGPLCCNCGFRAAIAAEKEKV